MLQSAKLVVSNALANFILFLYHWMIVDWMIYYRRILWGCSLRAGFDYFTLIVYFGFLSYVPLFSRVLVSYSELGYICKLVLLTSR